MLIVLMEFMERGILLVCELCEICVFQKARQAGRVLEILRIGMIQSSVFFQSSAESDGPLDPLKLRMALHNLQKNSVCGNVSSLGAADEGYLLFFRLGVD